MNALIIVLNETSLMDDIVSKMLELGVAGATILDSQGLGSAIARGDVRVPLFGTLKSVLTSDYPYSKTIFTVIEHDDLLGATIHAVKKILSDQKRIGVGFLFTVPVGMMTRLGNRPDVK